MSCLTLSKNVLRCVSSLLTEKNIISEMISSSLRNCLAVFQLFISVSWAVRVHVGRPMVCPRTVDVYIPHVMDRYRYDDSSLIT